MLTCVYGSSEFSQGFSRVSSLHASCFIINEEVELKKCNFTTEENENGEKVTKFDSLEFNFNDFPVKPKKGLIVGAEY